MTAADHAESRVPVTDAELDRWSSQWGTFGDDPPYPDSLLEQQRRLIATVRAERATVARLQQTIGAMTEVISAASALVEFDHQVQEHSENPNLDYGPFYERLTDAIDAYRVLLAEGGRM